MNAYLQRKLKVLDTNEVEHGIYKIDRSDNSEPSLYFNTAEELLTLRQDRSISQKKRQIYSNVVSNIQKPWKTSILRAFDLLSKLLCGTILLYYVKLYMHMSLIIITEFLCMIELEKELRIQIIDGRLIYPKELEEDIKSILLSFDTDNNRDLRNWLTTAPRAETNDSMEIDHPSPASNPNPNLVPNSEYTSALHLNPVSESILNPISCLNTESISNPSTLVTTSNAASIRQVSLQTQGLSAVPVPDTYTWLGRYRGAVYLVLLNNKIKCGCTAAEEDQLLQRLAICLI